MSQIPPIQSMLIRVSNGELLVTRLPDEHMTTLLTNVAHPDQLNDISEFLDRAQAGHDLYIDLGDGQPRGLLVKVEPGQFDATDGNGATDYLMALWHNKR